MVAQINVTTIANVSAYTIFIYDYMLTFGEEIDRFWTEPRLSWTLVFFIANRYLTLFGRIPAFVANFLQVNGEPYSHICKHLLLTDEFTMGLVQITGAVVMTIRVYAIYDKSRRVLYLLLSTMVITIAIGCYALLVKSSNSLQTVSVPPQGCLRSISSQDAPRYAAAWGGQLIFDAMVFGLTLRKLFSMQCAGRRSVVDVLLRDGAMYFAVMTVINTANITALLVAQPSLKSVLTSPTNMICSTMISRLMMNIRNSANESVYTRNLDKSTS